MMRHEVLEIISLLAWDWDCGSNEVGVNATEDRNDTEFSRGISRQKGLTLGIGGARTWLRHSTFRCNGVKLAKGCHRMPVPWPDK